MKANKSKTILVVILSIVALAAVIAGIVLFMRNKSEDKQAEIAQTRETVVIDEDEVANDRLLKDKYPEVNQLVTEYRKALTDGDVEALKKIYNTTDNISNDVLASTSKIIEGYSNTVCYTKKGLEDGSYFVFIYDDLKISGINTPAPNLTMVYVKTADDGSLYIYRGEKDAKTGAYVYDQTTDEYIQTLYTDAEVKDLMATVYQAKESASAKDEGLRNFLDGLTSPTSDATTETESETSTDETSADEAETEAETEAVG